MIKKENFANYSFLLIPAVLGVGYVLLLLNFPNLRFEISALFLLASVLAGGWLFYQKTGELKAERARAELAEEHIQELQKYVSEQDGHFKALTKSKDKYRHAAFHDTLTNLPNRNHFIETLRFLLEKTRKTSNYKFSVLFLDLNRFKTINESLGHSIGDKLIQHVAKRLSNCATDGDLVARFGGDEFAVILTDSDDRKAIGFAEKVKETISEPFILGGRKVYTDVAVGIASSKEVYKEAENILRDADIAMCYAKSHGNSYKVFDQDMHDRAVALLQFETDLRFAVERGELMAYFQPIVELNSMTLSGFESLIRWNHPKRGMISPADFIPVAEETGLIVPITLWMLKESCRRLKNWQLEYPQFRHSFISVNLSGKHFAEENLPEQINQILLSTLLDPACLKLEITESAVMENPEDVVITLGRLKALGVQLSIDDFGTGYSSLSYLHRFPIDTLKIDRSFVMAMERSTENREIIRTIVSLAKTLGMRVIAEGIETVEQLHQLRVLGCLYGQGYLFSRPVPPDEAARFFQSRANWNNLLMASDQILNAPPPVPVDESWRELLMK